MILDIVDGFHFLFFFTLGDFIREWNAQYWEERNRQNHTIRKHVERGSRKGEKRQHRTTPIQRKFRESTLFFLVYFSHTTLPHCPLEYGDSLTVIRSLWMLILDFLCGGCVVSDS